MTRGQILRGSLGILLTGCLGAYLVCLPRKLFQDTSYSTVVTDRDGELLGARTAADGQWRFPPEEQVPEKFAQAVVCFEDKYFYQHPGVNPVSLAKAALRNWKAGRITGGGSTLTMQVIRLSRQRERTLWQKLIECVLATRLELRCSKEEILGLYAAHAPFGGNIVGVEAASWRYFGRPASQLSWAESATLAVLPNAPSRMHGGKNRDAVRAKRDRLLDRLLNNGTLDEDSWREAREEPVFSHFHPLPERAYHLTEERHRTAPGQRSRTSLSASVQEAVQNCLENAHEPLRKQGVNDLSAVVIDLEDGALLAYVGNVRPEEKRPGAKVDIARRPRSTGSILKPFLYGALLQEGTLTPKALVPDIPVNIGGFAPQNFDRQFSGAVRADDALKRSLNVPAVHELRMFGVAKFKTLLQEAGLTTLDRDASDYGLSLILGGAEGQLLEITRAYAKLGRILKGTKEPGFPLSDRWAAWYTLEALKEKGARTIAWKTGTSYGFRDAWAVGLTPRFAIGVWAGNAPGQGVNGLTGASCALPVLEQLFQLMPPSDPDWFEEPPVAEGCMALLCPQTGYLHGAACPEGEPLVLPKRAEQADACPYHKIVDGESILTLPPAMEWYYRPLHPEYFPATKQGKSDRDAMAFIYPEAGSRITLSR